MSFATNLRTLIVADATAKALAESGNDTAVVARLNTPTETVHRRATNAQLLRWLAGESIPGKGRSTALREAAATGSNGAKSISATALALVESGVAEVTCDAEWWSLMDALVAAGVLQPSDKTALQNRIAETVGIAEATLGRPITTTDVSDALAGDRVDGHPGPIGG